MIALVGADEHKEHVAVQEALLEVPSIIRIIDISNRSDLCFRDLAKLPLGTKQGAASASRTCARVVEAVGECHDHSWHKK